MRLKPLCCLLLIFLLISCGSEEEQALDISDSRVAELKAFLAQKKFTEDFELMYPGAPNELVRSSAETIINDLVSRLIDGVPESLTKAYVLAQFELSLSQLTGFDSEENDRALLYFESMMDILTIENSSGLLNRWRYGFEQE